MKPDKKIALVAHDNMKDDLLAWAKYNRTLLAHHKLVRHGDHRAESWKRSSVSRSPSCRAGPWAGIMQVGAKIADGRHRLFDLLLGSPRTPAA